MTLVKISEHPVDSDTEEYKLETLQSEMSRSEDTEEYTTPGSTTKDSEHTHSKPEQAMENFTRMTEVEIEPNEFGRSSRITNYLERKLFVEQIGEKLEEQLVTIYGYA